MTGAAPLVTEERPWGTFTVLDDDGTHKVKRIVVHPGKRLSYQRHARRSEHWFIVHGAARVILDGLRRDVVAGDSVEARWASTTASRMPARWTSCWSRSSTASSSGRTTS